jgi:hypothetical protein
MGRGWDAQRDRSMGGETRAMRRGKVHSITHETAPRTRSEATAPAHEPIEPRKRTEAPATRRTRRRDSTSAGPATKRRRDARDASTPRTFGTGAGWLVGTVFLEGLRPLAVVPDVPGAAAAAGNRRPYERLVGL